MTYEIWSDNLNEADWFQNLDSRLMSARIRTIGRRASNPDCIELLIQYDRPDIILTLDERPILVVEKTQEVPTGHNVGQRFARIVRAAELGVPTLYFFPFDARKHGQYSGVCNVNARLLLALKRVSLVHSVPVLPVNWPSDSHGTLVWSGEENDVMAKLVAELLSNLGAVGPRWVEQQKYAEQEYEDRTSAFPKYLDLPSSVEIVPTLEMESRFPIRVEDLPPRTLARPSSLIYKMDMSPDKCRRQDPYTGMQFIYDYGWLRTGVNPAQRGGNLFLWIPRVSTREWLVANPEDYSTKSCNWYLIADGIILQDGFLAIENWPLAVG